MRGVCVTTALRLAYKSTVCRLKIKVVVVVVAVGWGGGVWERGPTQTRYAVIVGSHKGSLLDTVWHFAVCRGSDTCKKIFRLIEFQLRCTGEIGTSHVLTDRALKRNSRSFSFSFKWHANWALNINSLTSTPGCHVTQACQLWFKFALWIYWK